MTKETLKPLFVFCTYFPKIYLAHPSKQPHKYLNAMKVRKPKIKVVIGKLQIQDNTWVGNLYKGFSSIFNWTDL